MAAVAELGSLGLLALGMNIISHICVWVAVACLTTAVVWGIVLAIDSIRRAIPPSVGNLLSVVSLIAISLMGLGGMVIFSEIAKHQRGQRGATDGMMLFIFCAAGGVALLCGTFIVWFVRLFTRKKGI